MTDRWLDSYYHLADRQRMTLVKWLDCGINGEP